MDENIEILKTAFLLTYGHLSNGELYALLKKDSVFREKYWKCDKRLETWYLRDKGRKYCF